MALNSIDVSKMASATQIVFEALRVAIIRGELAAGSPLRQDDLARRFGTSRIPVREALGRLEQLGLIVTQRYRGAVVAGLEVEEAREIFDFRRVLETEVTRRAVPRMDAGDIERTRRCVDAFSACEDSMAWGSLNRELHLAIYEASGLSYHLEIINNAMDRVDRYLRAQLLMTDGMARATEEHLAIWEACAAGDGDGAAMLVGAHIDGARDDLILHLSAGGSERLGLAEG